MTSPKTRICTACNVEKSVKEFFRYRKGYDSKCRECSGGKICIRCDIRKSLELFRVRKNNRYEAICHDCEQQENKTRAKKRYLEKGRKEFINKYQNDLEFKERHTDNTKQWFKKHPEKIKEYNKKYQRRVNEWFRNKWADDPFFKMRRLISSSINKSLKKNNSSKETSIIDFLPYTINELKQHLESQFEPWMNWDNWGTYNIKTWDDNDSSTWTWQIDHIIPQSELPYNSMQHPNFKKCWDLANLRPLSARTNIEDGCRKRGIISYQFRNL